MVKRQWYKKNLTQNEEKSVVDESHIRKLKNKIYKYMTSVSKILYIDELDYIVNKYGNTYHETIKIKPIDVKASTCFCPICWKQW